MGTRTNLLFIGAGASTGARTESSHRVSPPLGNNVLHFLRSALREMKGHPSAFQIDSDLADAEKVLNRHQGQTNFEHLLTLLERKERLAIHRALQICFSDLKSMKIPIDVDLGFQASADLYDDLIIKVIKDPRDWIAVSLNYDVLLEQSLRRAGIVFHYPKVPWQLNGDSERIGMPIFKPHGSINFFATIDYARSASPEKIGHPKPMRGSENSKGDFVPEFPNVFAVEPDAENVVGRIISDSGYPIIANYTLGKDSDINHAVLSEVRAEFFNIADKISRAIVIGVRPIQNSADDPFCSRFFKFKFNQYDYVTLGGADAHIVKDIHPTVTTHSMGLSSYLDASS